MFKEYMESINNDYALSMMKVKAYMEASYRQHEINRMESELKVMNENGTDDDLNYLYQEADNNLGDRVKAAIQKIIEAFTNFISDVKDKIIKLFTSKERKDQIDKVEKKVKIFPLLGRKKVIIEDHDKQKSVYNEHMSKLDKIKAKIKAGHGVTKEDIDEENKSFAEKHAKAIGAGAVITVTLLTAIGIYKKRADKTAQDIGDVNKNTQLALRDAKQLPGPLATAYAESVSSASKTYVNDNVRSLSGIMKSVSEGIKKAKNTQVDTKRVAGLLRESYDDNYDMYEADEDMGGDDPEPNDSSDMKTEFDDPADVIDGFDNYDDSDEPDTDMWDDVMDDETGLDEDDIEKCEEADEQPDEAGDAPEPENGATEESYSESYIEDLFNDIVSSVTESEDTSDLEDDTESEVTTESENSSVVDSLLNDIDSLFD